MTDNFPPTNDIAPTGNSYGHYDELHCRAADEIERLRAALKQIEEGCSCPEDDVQRAVVKTARAALSPAPATDIQLPKGWLADEFARVDADVAQWSSGMKDSFKEATGIAIPPAPAPSEARAEDIESLAASDATWTTAPSEGGDDE